MKDIYSYCILFLILICLQSCKNIPLITLRLPELMQLSSDKFALITHQQQLQVKDAQGQLIRSIPTEGAQTVLFLPDHLHALVQQADGHIQIHDLTTNEDPLLLNQNTPLVQVASYLGTDEIVTFSKEGILYVWDVKNRNVKAQYQITWQGQSLTSYDTGTFFANGAYLALGIQGKLVIWDVAIGSIIWQGEAHTGPINKIKAFATYLVSGGQDGAVKLWSWQNIPFQFSLQANLEQYEEPVVDVELSLDEKKVFSVTNQYQGSLRFLNTHSDENAIPLHVFSQNEQAGKLVGAIFIGDHVISVGSGSELGEWMIPTSEHWGRSIEKSIAKILGEFIDLSKQGDLILTKVQNSHIGYLFTLQGVQVEPFRSFVSGCFSPDGLSLMISNSDTMLAISWDRLGNISSFPDPSTKDPLSFVFNFSRDGNYVIGFPSAAYPMVWYRQGIPLTTNPYNNSPAFSINNVVMFSNNNKFVFYVLHPYPTDPGDAYLWDWQNTPVNKSIRLTNDYVNTGDFSSDNQFLLLTPNSKEIGKAVKIWNLAEQKLMDQTITHSVGGNINTAEFSPDSQYILTASNDKTARLWGVPGVYQRAFLHEQEVRLAHFSPNSQFIVTASGSTALVWNLTGALLATLPSDHMITHAQFLADGQTLLTFDANSTVKVWQFSIEFIRSLPDLSLQQE